MIFGKKAIAKLFSLIELLVVIAILSILASLIQPSLKSITSNANISHCKKNLHNIGVALQIYLEDHHYYPYAVYKTNPYYLFGSWDDLLGQGYDGRNLNHQQVNHPFAKTAHEMYACPQQKSLSTITQGHLRSYAFNSNQDSRNWGGFSSFWGGWNHPYSASVNEVPAPSTSIVIAEKKGKLGDGYSSAAVYGTGDQEGSLNYNPELYHESQFNYLFADHHVELLLTDQTWNHEKGKWVYGKFWTRDPND